MPSRSSIRRIRRKASRSRGGCRRTSSCRPEPGSGSGRCGSDSSHTSATSLQDVVIAGHERDEVTALAFPAIGACRALCGANAEVALRRRELFERDVVRAAFCERLDDVRAGQRRPLDPRRAADAARGPSVDRRAGNYGQGVGQSEIRPDQSRRAGRTALRRRRSGNRHQSRHGRARRSGAGRRGPRERRRWGVRRGEAPRLIYDHRYGKAHRH